MTWNLDKSKALCPQICQQLCARIAAGEIQPGQRLMSVREVAVAAGVNPNTVQHAFEQLEQQGVVYSVRSAGWYANPDISKAQSLRETLIKEKTAAFFAELSAMGVAPADTKKIVEEWEI